MFNKSIIENIVKAGIKTWLKSICESIVINNFHLTINKKYFGKVDKIYFEAQDLIFQYLYINKIIGLHSYRTD